MKIFEKIYYFIVAALFLLAIFGNDFFGLKDQAIPIFFTEFAATMIMAMHSFMEDWNKNAPGNFPRNSKLEIIIVYLFFIIWAGGLLIKNHYFFALASFLISLAAKSWKILSFRNDKSKLRGLMALSFIQFLALWVSMFIPIAFRLDIRFSNLLWGVIYFSVLGLLLVIYDFWQNSKLKKIT